MQEVQATLPIGTIIQEKYVVEDILSKDNAGALYLVRDQRNQQHLFALKEVINLKKRDLYRYIFEFNKLQGLDHPALPHIYQIFRDEQDQVYVVMEYIQGSNLEVMRLQQPEQRFPLSHIMAPISSVLRAVSYLHSQRPPIIHRNIKPSNIIVTKATASSVLVGSGHEKLYDVEETITFIPRATSSYGAPEQYIGIVDPRTDIYALGATLYTLVTGLVPPDALYRTKKLSNKEPDPLIPVSQLIPALPTSIAETIHRAMFIDSEYRFSTVDQFWEALMQVSHTIVMEPQTAEPLAAIPNQKHVELDFNPTVQKAEEPGVEIEKAPSPNTGIMALGISDLPDDTPTPREVKTLIASSSQEPAKASRFNKHGMLLFMLFAALITLFGSIGVGASLWFEITSQRPPAVTFLPPTADSNVTVTSTLVPVPSSYPMIATQYTGTLYDIPTHTTISISLSHIQQRQGSFSGYLKGMPTSSALNGILQNDPFTGTINAAKQIQFVVMNTKGGTAFIFDGAIQLDRTIVGTYCNHRSAQGNCIDYGLWSISPAT